MIQSGEFDAFSETRRAAVHHRGSLEIKDVIARGRRLVRDGQLAFRENFLSESNRLVRLEGQLAPC
jgi:hypothetical protein